MSESGLAGLSNRFLQRHTTYINDIHHGGTYGPSFEKFSQEKGLDYLNRDGEIWAVIRKDQGAKSIIKEISKEASVEIKEKSKGFWIFFLKKN